MKMYNKRALSVRWGVYCVLPICLLNDSNRDRVCGECWFWRVPTKLRNYNTKATMQGTRPKATAEMGTMSMHSESAQVSRRFFFFALSRLRSSFILFWIHPNRMVWRRYACSSRNIFKIFFIIACIFEHRRRQYPNADEVPWHFHRIKIIHRGYRWGDVWNY